MCGEILQNAYTCAIAIEHKEIFILPGCVSGLENIFFFKNSFVSTKRGMRKIVSLCNFHIRITGEHCRR